MAKVYEVGVASGGAVKIKMQHGQCYAVLTGSKEEIKAMAARWRDDVNVLLTDKDMDDG